MRSHYMTLAALRLHYLDWGSADKPAIVCVHGLTGQAGLWDPFARAMSPQFHVVGLDQRGHGSSDWAADGYDPRSYVADLIAFIDHLGHERVNLIGLSLGAMVCIQCAATYSGRVERLVVVDIRPAPAEHVADRLREGTPYPRDFASLCEAVAWAGRDNHWAMRPEVLRRDLEGRLRRDNDGRWRWKADPETSAPAWIGLWSERSEAHWGASANVRCPILALRGMKSDVVTEAIKARMQSESPRCEWLDLGAAGHNVVCDEPDAFTDAARVFLGL